MSPADSILVTGAAGFIGSTLVDRLLAEGRSVVGLDSFDPFYPESDKLRNLAGALDHTAFDLVRGDIRDAQAVSSVFGRGVDAVVHLAALAGVRPSLERPVEYTDVNLRGTALLLDAAVEHGNPNFVFASSSSVYGERTDGPFLESDRVDLPISPYAATKKSGELVAHTFHSAHGLPVSCVRFFTAYGPRQRPDLAIRKFADRILSQKRVGVFGDGSARRDFTFIDDIVDGLVRAVDARKPWGIFNFGAGRTISVLEMIETLSRELGCEAEVEFLPRQTGDVSCTWANIDRAREELGYSPAVSFEEGIRRFAAWLRQL
jgi:UDP-glucuronate 4-epimerase